jgi:hypothetical protein
VQDDTPAVIVLAKVETRYYQELDGPYQWSLEFCVYEKGATVPLVSSVHDTLWSRSVTAEIDLRAGEYVVHVGSPHRPWNAAHHLALTKVRLDRRLTKSMNFIQELSPKWNGRKRTRKLTEMALSESIAASEYRNS